MNVVLTPCFCLTPFLFNTSFSMSASECYSESEHDDPEITDTPPPPYMAQSQPPQLVSVILISFIW